MRWSTLPGLVSAPLMHIAAHWGRSSVVVSVCGAHTYGEGGRVGARSRVHKHNVWVAAPPCVCVVPAIVCAA